MLFFICLMLYMHPQRGFNIKTAILACRVLLFTYLSAKSPVAPMSVWMNHVPCITGIIRAITPTPLPFNGFHHPEQFQAMTIKFFFSNVPTDIVMLETFKAIFGFLSVNILRIVLQYVSIYQTHSVGNVYCEAADKCAKHLLLWTNTQNLLSGSQTAVTWRSILAFIYRLTCYFY